jgi:hypothetical protein
MRREVLVEKPGGKKPLGRPSRRWMLILELFLRNGSMLWTGFIWLRIGTVSGLDFFT